MKTSVPELIEYRISELYVAKACVISLFSLPLTGSISEAAISTKACQGCFGFQEYAAFQWLHHIELLANEDESYSQEVLQVLNRCLKSNTCEVGSSHLKNVDRTSYTDVWGFIRAVKKAQEPQDIFQNLLDDPPASSRTTEDESSDGFTEVPNAMHVLSRCRKAIESAFETPDWNRELLVSAYGETPFRCHVIACEHFVDGFRSRKMRDEHTRGHDRSFKCAEPDCDYSILGCPSKQALERHMTLVHSANAVDPQFPDLRPQTLLKSLETAIDRNDCISVEQLCLEVKDAEDFPQGLVLRALKKNYVDITEVLVKHLGDRDEPLLAKEKHSALCYAAKWGHEILFQRFLSMFEQDDVNGYRSLHIALNAAASQGHANIIRKGLRDYTDRHKYKRCNNPRRIVATAIKAGHEKVIAAMCDLFPISDQHHNLYLEQAIRAKARSCIKFLLEKYGFPHTEKWSKIQDLYSKESDTAIDMCFEMNVGVWDHKIQAAFNKAAAEGDLEEVKLLLDRGARLKYGRSSPNSAIYIATAAGHEPVVRFLLERGAVTGINCHNSIFQTAIKKSFYKILQLLLDFCNPSSGRLNELYWLAVAEGNEPMIRLLVEAGADINSNEGREMVLATASCVNNEPMVKLILDRGANVGLNERLNMTQSLSLAASDGFEGVVKRLLKAGADANCTSAFTSSSPLQEASKNNHQSVVTLLLDAGANVNHHQNDGTTALLSAVENGHVKIVQQLLDAGAELQTSLSRERAYRYPIQMASMLDHGSIVVLLLKAGADANANPSDGESALYLAAQRGFDFVVKQLLEAGADPDLKYIDTLCQTPLQIASFNKHEDVVKLLLEGGANVNAAGAWNASALFFAVWQGNLSIVERLLQHGADANNRSLPPHGRSLSVLDVAVKYGHQAVRERLERALTEMETNRFINLDE